MSKNNIDIKYIIKPHRQMGKSRTVLLYNEYIINYIIEQNTIIGICFTYKDKVIKL